MIGQIEYSDRFRLFKDEATEIILEIAMWMVGLIPQKFDFLNGSVMKKMEQSLKQSDQGVGKDCKYKDYRNYTVKNGGNAVSRPQK